MAAKFFKRWFQSRATNDMSALGEQAAAEYRAGDFAQAAVTFTQILDAIPQDVSARIGRGQVYLDLGQASQARADFLAALRLDSRAVHGHFFWRGQTFGQRGQIDQEIATYDYVLDLDPNCAVAYGARGNAYRERREFPRALADCNAAIALDANDALFANRGRVHLEMGNARAAVADFSEAIRLNPGDPLHYFGRAAAHGSLGDRARQARDEQRGRELGGNAAGT